MIIYEKINYIYDATGIKLQKIVTDIGNSTKTNYAGNYIYEDNGTTEELKFFNQPEGYVEPTVTSSGVEMNYFYQYKDHLGNIRLSYKNTGTVSSPILEIVEENNYYPFGLKHKGYNNVVTSTNIALKKKFGGKEYQDELGLGWIDITARNYDPSLGRWMNIDPLAEFMRRHSPYNYAFDNPIYFIDADGMAPESSTENNEDPPWWLKWVTALFSDDVEKMNSKGDISNDELDNIEEEKVMDAVVQTNEDFNDTFSATVEGGVSVKEEETGITLLKYRGKLTIRLLDGVKYEDNVSILEPNLPSLNKISINSGNFGASPAPARLYRVVNVNFLN